MIERVTSDFCLFDSLIAQDRSFSVYRLPGADDLSFVMQRDGTPEDLLQLSELNGRTGFVIAPFEQSTQTPIVLLRPDIVLEGNQILEELRNLTLPEKVGDRSIPETMRSAEESYLNYQKAFELFQSALRSNTCKKIVLSRPLDKPRPNGFSAGLTFQAACDSYPEAFVYLCHTPGTGTWLGSSPELILYGKETDWRTVALAGTMKSTPDDASVRWDEKNISEQDIVADYLGRQLDAHRLAYTRNGPFTSKAGGLVHLKTEFSFQMDDSDRIGDLLDTLHPTPAVCGFPKEEAYRLILAQEGYDRKYYSGFIGPLSLAGKTDLFVNLRCMQILAGKLTLYAGGGLLPSSELASEWEETEQKLQTMLSLIHY